MRLKKTLKNIGPLHVGQLIRVTRPTLLPGHPVLERRSWIDEVNEGVLEAIHRIDGGVMLTISGKKFPLGVSPIGPLLNHHWGKFEVIEAAKSQGILFGGDGA